MISSTAKHLFYVKLIIIFNYYRSTYNNLKRSYQHFGQFQYLYKGNQGKIVTYVDEGFDGYEKFLYTIIGNNSYLFWSIKVYKKGKIREIEWSNWSKFMRKRVIYKTGLWEESSYDDITRFGIRKVVYPDGQQFINEVYDYRKRWNAIGEETYAIQNKSIPYLLENHREMEEYRFVSEDGLLNIIDLGWNYNKEI